jgi:hypothetical protein
VFKGWKIAVGAVVGLLLVAVVAGVALAQGPDAGDGERDLVGGGLGLGRGNAYGFVDEDGDGINDRYADREFVDEDGDGVCDVCGGEPGAYAGQGYGRWMNETQSGMRGAGRGYGFVDEDGDGINDRYGTNPAFVDEDGDGVCDEHGVVPGQGMRDGSAGYGNARGGGRAR